jgi:hypothetical protein
MKKRTAAIAALLGAAVVVLGLPTVATTAAPDVRGPKCADIMLVGLSYTGTEGGTALVEGTLITPQAPSCEGAVYTVFVDGESVEFTGDALNDAFALSISVENAPSTICVYATSQLRENAIAADTAPDTACSDPTTGNNLVLNGGGGASGFG